MRINTAPESIQAQMTRCEEQAWKTLKTPENFSYGCIVL
jgi:pyrimidine deaminase RibD-like protein